MEVETKADRNLLLYKGAKSDHCNFSYSNVHSAYQS